MYRLLLSNEMGILKSTSRMLLGLRLDKNVENSSMNAVMFMLDVGL